MAAASGLREFEEEAKNGGGREICQLVFQVALCSLSIAVGFYHAGRFTPDHPTRDSDILAPTRSLSPETAQEIMWFSTLRGFQAMKLQILIFIRFSIALGPLSSMDFDKALRFLAAFLCIFLQHLMTRWIPLVVAAPSPWWLETSGISSWNGIACGCRSKRHLFVLGPRLLAAGTPFQELVWGNPPGLDEINSLLANFGRHLFEQSKHYSHYSETLNAVPTHSLCCADHLVMLGTWLHAVIM